ncbi:MAG TPA: hypothetical protein P5282_05680 [Anaerolineaceae bacterium]|nr:hypothetical protein [Anaerolineaceae bacterium]
MSNALNVLTLGGVRNFLQIPDPQGCKWRTLYYGKECQLMEVDGVKRAIRGAVTPLRTINTQTGRICTVGRIEEMPDIQQATIRFLEEDTRGIPLPHVLGQCSIRVINNYGLCGANSNAANGWSNYSEVIELLLASEDRGRRSSLDGTDDEIRNEVVGDVINHFDIGKISFSRLDIPTNMNSNSAAFGCYLGCGQASCSCAGPCDDGTRSIYVGASLTGSTGQYVYYSGDGGKTVTRYTIPTPVSTYTDSTYPQVALFGGYLWVLAHGNPAHLWRNTLSSSGAMSNEWVDYELLTDNGIVTDGTPLAMYAGSKYLHMLTFSAVNGTKYYRMDLDGAIATNPANKKVIATYTFPLAALISHMAVCGDKIAVCGSGGGGTLYLSKNGGTGWDIATVPAISTALTAVCVTGNRIWIGDSSGQRFYTDDSGATWNQIKLSPVGVVNDIVFSGDIGWTANNNNVPPFSTWLGGEQADYWLNGSPRFPSWPSQMTVNRLFTPGCAGATTTANTVMAICSYGPLATQQTHVAIGRAVITYGLYDDADGLPA